MTRLIIFLAVLVVGCQHDHTPPASPYADQAHDPTLVSLTPDQVVGYREGQGLGFAKAAELQGYPGPKHVLELDAALELTAEQRAQTQALFDAMQADAQRLGALFLEQEAALNGLFAAQEADSAAVAQLAETIGQVEGQLRAAQLQAHLEMVEVLTPEQVAHYQTLRGYDGAAEGGHDPSQHAH